MFVALENAKTSLFLALVRKVFLLVPLILLLPLILPDPVVAVYLAEPITDTLACTATVTMVVRYYRKYSAPKGWYGTHYVARLSKELPEDTLRQMHGYYEKLLRKYPDVVTVKDVVTLTGYTLTTVHNWCSRGSLKAFQKGLKFCIPKIFLVDFFCSLTFRSITRKSLWHIQTLNEFSRKMKK